MNRNGDTDSSDLLALIGLWQNEEERLRVLIENPQTSASVRDQASERLNSVLDQIRAIVDEKMD